MRIPNPKAVTTTEAYLAYKAEVLEQSELKDKLYHPYLHVDGWLAYWTELTATYPTDKNGDPECLTDEEAYIAYLAGVTSEYPEALKDPADVRVASYLRYLISARFGRPDYPVTREEFYLSMMKPRFIPSGDPSSEIELDGTVEAPFVDLKMYGDSFQQTYSGKNLFKCPNLSSGTGITRTRLGDNSFKAEVSSTDGNKYTTISYSLSPNTTYYFSVDISISGTSTTHTGYIRPQIEGSYLGWYNSGFSFTTGASGNVNFLFYNYSDNSGGDTVSNTVTWSDIQIEQGSSATSYEPYVGGTASPNPDYPQDIDVVTGRQVVRVNGKNLWKPAPDGTSMQGGITSVRENGVITLTGTATSSATGASPFYDLDTPLPAGTYTFSIPNPLPYRFEFVMQDSDGNNHFPVITAGSTSGTITTTWETVKIRNGIGGYSVGTEVNLTIKELQLEVGSTATAYQPYQSQSYEINLGKNLLNNYSPDVVGSNITWIPNETGGTFSKTASGNWGDGVQWRFKVEVGKTYHIRVKIPDDKPVYMNVASYTDSTYSVRKTALYNDKRGDVAESFVADSEFILVRFANNATPAESAITDLEFGAGPVSPYAKYFEPIELCKIGNHQDYIYRDEDGDWYVHKEISKYIFTKNDSWSAESYGTNSWRASKKVAVYNYASDKQAVMFGISKGVPFDTRGSADSTFTCVCYTNPNGNFIVRNTNITTADGIKDASIGKKLYYWGTPSDTLITNSELISQLDALVEGGSYNGKTYIKVTATDPNLPGLLYVEAAV